MLAFTLVIPAHAAKKDDKNKIKRNDKGVRIFRPHIKGTPSKVDFFSESQVSGRLNEKHSSGVIVIPLEKLQPVNSNVPKPAPPAGASSPKPATTAVVTNS